MISEQEIERAAEASESFTQAILSARYYADTDRIEFVTPWCILIVDRQKIEELRHLAKAEIETIYVSTVGVHVDPANVDINSAGLITHITQQLEKEVANSF